MKENTSNIPATGFAVMHTQSTNERKTVNFNSSAFFSFSSFSLIQLLMGVRLNSNKDSFGNSKLKRENELLSKLAMLPHIGSKNEDGNPTIELLRDEVQLLREWLEARMKHCEQERDERATIHDTKDVKIKGKIDLDNLGSPVQSVEDNLLKFNPDTYIAQKFLLLDLREWLIGDILD